MTSRPRRTLVAERDGVVLGFVTVKGDAPVGELGMLIVAPEATGAGIGSVLFRRALATARDLGFRLLTIESDPTGHNKALWPGNTDDYLAQLGRFDLDAYRPCPSPANADPGE
ncbi:GNAT family N-acetyltransferase [Nocardia farcinica]|uniref:GNAT family N-acetyltransferase n=1 Tax=Nocardia farcinica TaxID=37329 RepID=UPI0034D49F77